MDDFDVEREVESFAECGCPTYPIEGGMVEVIHYEGWEHHNPTCCQVCEELANE